MRSITGDMMCAESTAASPVSTIVGGACWVPIAERASESTTAIFEKLVSISTAKGSSDITASIDIIASGLPA